VQRRHFLAALMVADAATWRATQYNVNNQPAAPV